MKGKQFELIQGTDIVTTVRLAILMKKDFQNGFGKWQDSWDKRVQIQREYTEEINGCVSFTLIHFLRS